MPLQYGQYASDVLLRAHLLPYVLPIRSERQLAFAVAEKDALRHCVGLIGDNSPQRGTLWHFRKRNPHFRQLLVRGLSIIYLEAQARQIAIPFLDSCSDHGEIAGDRHIADTFQDPKFETTIEIGPPVVRRLIEREKQLLLPLNYDVLSIDATASRLLLPYEIGFPLRVLFRRLGYAGVGIVFRQPSWLDKPNGSFDIGDNLGRATTPYTACNIVVMREYEGRNQILLSKRLQGAGIGSYTLPGGKKRENESVIGCVRRELEEETGLILANARPISIRVTKRAGFPRVRSVGVLAKVRGKPQRRERHQHSNWQWYDLADLPEPLFFPTQLVLKDYRNRNTVLSWEQVEDAADDLPLWRKT